MNTKKNKQSNKKNSAKLSSNLICEEFCYSGLKPLQITIFPSNIFETENINYILSGIKKIEQFTNEK